VEVNNKLEGIGGEKMATKVYQQSKKLIQHHNQGKTLAIYESFWGIESWSKNDLAHYNK
jgi:hypothetical protein